MRQDPRFQQDADVVAAEVAETTTNISAFSATSQPEKCGGNTVAYAGYEGKRPRLTTETNDTYHVSKAGKSIESFFFTTDNPGPSFLNVAPWFSRLQRD